MKVGILGSGDVAKALADGFLKHGHEVMLGTRDSAKLADWKANTGPCRCGQLSRCGQICRARRPGGQGRRCRRRAARRDCGESCRQDRARRDQSDRRRSRLSTASSSSSPTLDDSLMERLQREFGGARFVKAFNPVGNACMVNPKFKGGQPTMFICGNDEAAKKTVTRNPRSVWLGNGRHGQGGGRAGN